MRNADRPPRFDNVDRLFIALVLLISPPAILVAIAVFPPALVGACAAAGAVVIYRIVRWTNRRR